MKFITTLVSVLFALTLNAQQTVSFAQLRKMADDAPSFEIEVNGDKTWAAAV